MQDCHAYMLVSTLVQQGVKKDIELEARQIFQLKDILRTKGYRCDFSLNAFEKVAMENPGILTVSPRTIVVKKAYFQRGYKFLVYNQNKEVEQLIYNSWQTIIQKGY